MFCCALGANAQQSKDVLDYINKYQEIAITEMLRTGVPASITLAQGILESGTGKSDLALKSNNHFGIKCKEEWTGDKSYHDDDKRGECFRVYKTVEDSYQDHSDFLKNRPYYTSLFNLNPEDYKNWAYGLKKAGYATERNYAEQLIGLIERYNLQTYSSIALARKKAREERSQDAIAVNGNSAVNNMTSVQETKPTAYSAAPVVEKTEPKIESVAPKRVEQTMVQPPAYPTAVFAINGAKVVYVAAGSSLLALATQYNVSYRKLMEYNESVKSDIFDKNRLIYLEKKSKKGASDTHLVAQGETLDDIAQKEGVQLAMLALYNHIDTNAQPVAGEIIYLRYDAPKVPQLAMAN
jgi:LysM repeat protein